MTSYSKLREHMLMAILSIVFQRLVMEHMNIYPEFAEYGLCFSQDHPFVQVEDRYQNTPLTSPFTIMGMCPLAR